MASTADQKAQELIHKAQKAMKKSFFSSADPATAAECYEKAANFYKLEKNWERAGELLESAADCLSQDGQGFAAGRKFSDAGVAYKNVNPAKAEAAFGKACAVFIEEGKAGQAAKVMKELSELQEKDNPAEALVSLRKAIDYHEAGNEPVAASQLKSKAAPLAAAALDWVTAAELFEDAAQATSTTTGSVDYYFCAALCFLAMKDSVAASKALDKYGGRSIDFLKSAECHFLDGAIKAIDNVNKPAFEEAFKLHQKNFKLKLDNFKNRTINKILDEFPADGDEELL